VAASDKSVRFEIEILRKCFIWTNDRPQLMPHACARGPETWLATVQRTHAACTSAGYYTYMPAKMHNSNLLELTNELLLLDDLVLFLHVPGSLLPVREHMTSFLATTSCFNIIATTTSCMAAQCCPRQFLSVRECSNED